MSDVIEINESNFEKEVLNAKEPVVIDFWAEWCGPCKMFVPVLNNVATEYKGRFKIGKVNIDENPKLTERFSVVSIPTLAYFSNGKLHGQSVGIVTKKEIVRQLEDVEKI